MTMFALQRRAVDCGITVSSLHPGTVQQIANYINNACNNAFGSQLYVAMSLKVNTEIVRGCEDIWWTPALMAAFKLIGDDILAIAIIYSS